MIDRLSLQGFELSDKTAAVIGCGGLGCHVATHLACAGIGRLLLCDFDTVSETNLNRQFLYTAADIGKEKVFQAKERLSATAPGTEISAFSKKIEAAEDLAFAGGADILFAAVDNNAARAALEAFSAMQSIPLVNGGVNGFFGTAYLYLPGKTPGPAAAGLLTAENRRTLSVSSTVGLIGALEAHLGIRCLLGDSTAAGKLHVFDGGEVHILPLKQTQ